jgi:flagellar protein FlaG
MSSTAPIPNITPDVTPVQAAPASAQGTGTSPAPQSEPTASDLRLVIEDDKAAGSYVYVTIDSVTGQVVSQVPREQLLKMRENPDYTPGSVFDSHS